MIRYTITIIISFTIGVILTLAFTRNATSDVVGIQAEYHVGELERLAFEAFEGSEVSTAVWLMETYEDELLAQGPYIFSSRVFKLKKLLISLGLFQLYSELGEIEKAREAFELARFLSDEFEDVKVEESENVKAALNKFNLQRNENSE